MAQKRMFNISITDTDKFLDMPASTQNLYFHLNMHADDDGFVDSPKRIMRNVSAHDDDMNVLLAKQFVFKFESGIILIRDWKIHNVIRKDTYKPTLYQNEKNMISIDSTGAYQMRDEPVSQTRLDKTREEKNRIDKDRQEQNLQSSLLKELESITGRMLSPTEIEEANKLVDDINEEMVIEAFKRARLQGKTSFAYVKGIIRNWKEDGYTTVEQVKASKRKEKQEDVSKYGW